ncbi:hypothetical protein QBC34DRAFT_101008 [Podospora aff. communis PSN243]|uniref:NACHT-NTPase and P-loop NTPases N-terminal domain-containing protein n=1 Tax=Podospora aff. communis PSN243 TaxID=3040156 RepID=A0AAV9GL97_9PEZI|nr:hypothetical protein QBC34DRAFT_101008 [Podospora aff. communis PSN243]
MAEALAAIGLASSLVQLITFSSKLLTRLTESPSSIPKSLHRLQSDLLVLLDALHATQSVVDAGYTSHALYPAVHNCRVQIETLNLIIVKLLPRPGDSWAARSKRVIASLRQDAQVAEIRARMGSRCRC